MSSANSILSTTSTLASYGRKIAQHGKPCLDIVIDNHHEGKTYTTFDAISGKVNITAPHNARFDAVKITLEGTTKTHVDSMAPTSSRSRTTATHNFLRLVMPIRESDYPQPRIAEAGRIYSFSFNFVIPDRLLPKACSHECAADYIHDAHLQLPPSMGDILVSLQDDLAPEMSKTQYAVKVKVIRSREQDAKNVVLVEGQKKLRIVPTVPEAPPMSHGFDDYLLSKTKKLRKGMFSGKLGRITVSAEQTGALILPAPSASSKTPATTLATVNLRFDPHDESSIPPRLGGLTTKIKATTFYAARPASGFPTKASMVSQFEMTKGIYHTSVPLSSRCVESVTWEKRQPAAQRRNSDSSTSSSDDCSDNVLVPEAKANCVYYTATILVPITLPTNKAWIPTFHSCILSRTYTIDLTLAIHTPGTAVPASSVALHLPVQIAAEGNQLERPELTPAEAAAELAEANEFFRPRVIEVPREELVGNSVLARAELPPSYEDFLSRPQVVLEAGRW